MYDIKTLAKRKLKLFCSAYMVLSTLSLVNDIRILPSYPHFTLISAFYPHIRTLPSYPSVRPSIRIRVLP